MTCLYILPWINESQCLGRIGYAWEAGMVNGQGHDPNWIWIWIYPVWDSMIYPVLRGGISSPTKPLKHITERVRQGAQLSLPEVDLNVND